MKSPSTYTLAAVVQSIDQNKVHINGIWVPARPLGGSGIKNRMRAAWMVFTGKADAFTWPCGQ